MKMKMWQRLLKKNRSLRAVNLLGLSVAFACMLLSYAYVKREWSYDRFHEKAGRIVRLSIRYDDEPVDGRIYGFSKNDVATAGAPGVENVLLMSKVETAMLTYRGEAHVVNNFYAATSGIFDLFDFKLTEGDRKTVLDAPEKAVISRRFAKELFGEDAPEGKELQLSSRRFEQRTVFVAGVFEDFPENSHFHTDLLLHLPDDDKKVYMYAYLLLHPHAGMEQTRQTIAAWLDKRDGDRPRKASPLLTPLTDIHLHGHAQREMEKNGNIRYIYIIAGMNLLLLAVVIFNLRLNAGLIFAHNRKYYRLLRLHGASSLTVLADESRLALTLGTASALMGGLWAYVAYTRLQAWLDIPGVAETALLCLLFVGIVWATSLLPAMRGMSTTLFLNGDNDLRPSHFSLSGARFLLIAQFAMGMFILIFGFGINRQMRLIKTVQAGGHQAQTVLAMKEQPDAVKERYEALKAELLKYPEIEAVTSAMQLPGTAIRDRIFVRREDEAENEGRNIPLLVTGDDFLPFFDIVPVAGRTFRPSTLTYEEEGQLFLDRIEGRSKPSSPLAEEYIVNRSAMRQLGFASPGEATGKMLHLRGSGVDYISKGRIVGVTGDFVYTTACETATPLILLQRRLFQHCIMVRLSPGYLPQATAAFNRVWKDVIPGYPPDYTFLQDVYDDVYHSERTAEALVRLFSLLSLPVANMGLVIVMDFVVRRKTKEIGIRKVNGATATDIVRLLNGRITTLWIATAFVVAAPLAWWAMTHWLENFARKIPLDWQLFASAGLLVWLLSVLAVSWQSLRAARLNPVESIKTE